MKIHPPLLRTPLLCLATAALLLTSALRAQIDVHDDHELPNFDRRAPRARDAAPPGQAVSAAARQRAKESLREKVKHVRIEEDDLLGTAAFVGSPHAFLSGRDGRGGGISDQALARHDANDPHRAIKAFIDDNADVFGHRSEVVAAARVLRDYVTVRTGLRTIHWEQRLDDIAIFEATLQAHVTKNGELVSLASKLLPEAEKAAERGTPGRGARVAAPAIGAREAVALAAQHVAEVLEADAVTPLGEPQGAERKQSFRAPALLEVQARYVWLPIEAETLRLCWEVIATGKGTSRMFRVLIDAGTGELQVRQGLTEDASPATYNVFTSDSPSPFSPGHSAPSSVQPPLVARTLVTTSALSTVASPNGWIDDSVLETRGNNVDAHTDLDANNVADLPRPQAVGVERVFNPPLDLAQPPSTYRAAAVVNLFYWCNFMHDRLHQLGFTEAAGNFQNDNFGRGGLGNDAVQADAQDGSGTNNANFSTPPDGSPGRMQMYVFSAPEPDRDGDFDAEIILHEYTHGLSNRLVGGGVGMSALQSRGMGEGWSDFYAMALLSEPGDDASGAYPSGGYSTYLLNGGTQNYYFGIRRYPFSTDLAKNPLTFRDIDPTQASAHAGVPRGPNGSSSAAEVHNVGEVWCVTLWDARANLIAKHGYAMGNELILQLVTDGMKLAPANPTFVQARDAILQADLVATGGANQGALWAAFAKRGLGAQAVAPASTTTTGVVESFEVPDALSVNPIAPILTGGNAGGPFPAQTYTLSNLSAAPLAWSAGNTQTWATLSPASGTLAGGASVGVTLSFNAGANTLPQGAYNETLTFTNATSGVSQTRAITLTVGPAPAIASFSPTAIASGMAVTINGAGFIAPLTVRFNGLPAASTTIVSSSQIVAVAPASLTAGPITVTTGVGVATSAGNYTVSFAPTITGFTPTSGPHKRMVALTGFNFSGGAVTSRTVRVNGVSVGSLSVSPTRLTFAVPVGATSGPITVQTNLGTATSATNFVVASGPPPPNDNFASAQVISGSSGFVAVNNTNATKQPGELRHAGNSGGASLWYAWTAPTSGPYLFQPPDAGLNMGVVQAIYVGNSVDALALVASGSAGSAFSRYPSSAAFVATAGTTYRIALDGYDGLMGEFNLTWAPLTPPAISTIAASAYPGQQVVITGSGFAPGAAVTIGGVPIASSNLSYGSSSSIAVVQLPSNVPSGPITVSTLAGTATSAASLTVLTAPAPSIASFSPSSGQIGSQVVINGTGLSLGGPTPPVVRFNGAPVTTIQFQSPTTLLVRVPTGATNGTISVQTTQGTATSAGSFTVTTSPTPIPFIFDFAPASGPVGSQVTLNGANFTGVTGVQLNGAALPFTINSANQITATIPAGASSGVFRTIAGSVSTTSTSAFTVTTPPVISGFAPTAIAAGTQVTITGANFSGASLVSFNGAAAAGFTVDSSSQITATAPGGTLMPGPISVTTQDGTATSAASFTLAPTEGPTISAFTPMALSNWQHVVITGTNFNDVVSVAFNGLSASFTVNSSTQITSALPSGATAGAITVTTTKGTATSPYNYTIAPPAMPSVSDFSPGAIASGAAVTINGSGFSGVTSVLFNGVNAIFRVVSPTQIVATAPAVLAAGSITVVTSLGSATSASAYTLTLAPIISDFTPSSGPTNRIVTVNGANFLGAGITTFSVRVNGVAVSSSSRSSTRVTFPVPAGATTGPITITTNNGVATSATDFVVAGGTPPANDAFANARVISGSASFTTGSLANATRETGEPIHAGNPGGGSVWFAWTAPSSGWFLFNPSDPASQHYGVIQALYTGDALNALTLVAAGQTPTNPFARYGSAAALNAIAGTTYRIALDGYNGLQPDYRLQWSPLVAPTIASFSPTSGVAGQTMSLGISGTNFVPGAIVRIGGAVVDSARTVYNSSTSITVTRLPADATTGPITVTTPLGTATTSGTFTVLPAAPTISGFTPAAAPVGASVVISGANLTGATVVEFGGQSASFTVDSGTQITALVPAGAASGPIRVVTPGGSATSAASFTVIVPPSITQDLVSQTATVGDTVVFALTVTGNGSLQYLWFKNGVVIPSATTATLTLPGITVADAGFYSCVVLNEAGAAVSALVRLTVNKALAAVALVVPSGPYTGTPKVATATTVPAGLSVAITYNGSLIAPTDVGSYAVVGTVNDPNYSGSAADTLTITKATATIALGGLAQVYDGTPKAVTATTSPAGLTVNVLYNGSATAPTLPGAYPLTATIDHANYQGSTTATLVVSTTALVRHAGAVNGELHGSMQVLLPEDVSLTSGALISGDLLVPGTPTIRLNGNPVYGSTIDAGGAAAPAQHVVTLSGNSVLRHVVRRVDPITLATVAPPPAPAGTRDIRLNAPGEAAGDFATLRDLTLNGRAGLVAVPPGTYGAFTSEAGTGFVFGVAGATEPAVYNLQRLTLNPNSELRLAGPVVLNVANGVSIKSIAGASAHPEWLVVRVAAGGVELRGAAELSGRVIVPNGTVAVSGATLRGTVEADTLSLEAGGVVEQPDAP